MERKKYLKEILDLFELIQSSYDCQMYIEELQKEHLEKLNKSSEEEIISKKLYKEHHLVRYYRKTCLDIDSFKEAYNTGDLNKLPSINGLKNELFILNNFKSKLHTAKIKKIS